MISGAALSVDQTGIVRKGWLREDGDCSFESISLELLPKLPRVLCRQLHLPPCRLGWTPLLRCRCESYPHVSRESETDRAFITESGGGNVGSQHGARAKVSPDVGKWQTMRQEECFTRDSDAGTYEGRPGYCLFTSGDGRHSALLTS